MRYVIVSAGSLEELETKVNAVLATSNQWWLHGTPAVFPEHRQVRADPLNAYSFGGQVITDVFAQVYQALVLPGYADDDDMGRRVEEALRDATASLPPLP